MRCVPCHGRLEEMDQFNLFQINANALFEEMIDEQQFSPVAHILIRVPNILHRNSV